MRLSLCNGWEFTPNWSAEFAYGKGEAESVRLPHNVLDTPLHYTDHSAYQMICGYRRRLDIPAEYQGKRLFLQFDGAGHIATVYVDGQKAGHHRTGYTAFRVEITDFVTPGKQALISVELDTTENPTIPPFGFVIDYLTYGGLYREVWLDVREQSLIEDVFVTTPATDTAHVEVKSQGASDCRLSIWDAAGSCVASTEGCTADLILENAHLWSNEDPYRYTLRCELIADGRICDVQELKFGFRTAEFKTDGFYLNGKRTFLRGLNRHQSFPYMGYAAPESLQREDARILKEELGCVAVRTSHYPQSQYFIDECDRLGLLVFTEIPGWQHIGDLSWQDQAVENVKEMVLQYRNHPSIVLWGVRINESGDNDAFYARTNALCRLLDPSRPTSGVRCMDQSSFLEDVYARNDFSHVGSNPGVRPRSDISPDPSRPYLVSEHTGHMFPTKAFDSWERRQEQALRHARVQNASSASGESCGCFGWCMFDYATHKDFGSGDRICYHGVLDAFRNPKLAAYTYASQLENTPVLELGSAMDIGDYNGGVFSDLYIFTNADTVALYRDGDFVTRYTHPNMGGLKNYPIHMNDTVGCLLETREGFPHAVAEDLRQGLLAIARYDINALPEESRRELSACLERNGLSWQQGVSLYGKYIANWGGAATRWRLDGEKDGKVVSSLTRQPNTSLHLELKASNLTLQEKGSYDCAVLRIRILDANGCVASYAQLPVMLTLEGEAELIGPSVVTAEGGMCGTYIRTTGKKGTARLTVSTAQTEAVSIEFTIL